VSASRARHQLRLVGGDDPRSVEAWAQDCDLRAAVAAENASAVSARLDPSDPRWVLAVRTQSQLQGTVLTPERRERVMATARTLGIRPFEANVIMAIVQDHARCGRRLDEISGQLALLQGRSSADRMTPWLAVGAAIVAASATALLIVRWLLGT